MGAFIPSPEQQAIFDAVLTTDGNLAINALAGTGKTTTLVELARKLPAGTKLFCAFNKDIVADLEKRLGGTGMIAKTFHAIGLAALKANIGKDVKIDDGKYRKLVSDWSETSFQLRSAINDAISSGNVDATFNDLSKGAIKMGTEILRFLRLRLVDPNDLDGIRGIIRKYALDDDIEGVEEIASLVIGKVPDWMKQAESMTRELKTIDFTDMIYWGVVWKLPIQKYAWVFVDEAQDLSPMQREMVRRTIASGGRIVLVGDPNQAIYAFAGADSDSFDLSAKMFNASVLPLTLTRRCSKVVTYHSADLVAGFRCPEDRTRGKVIWTGEEQMLKVVQPGDMILCRVRAPLVGACLDFLANGQPATILGADIAKALVAIVEKLKRRRGYTFERLDKVLDEYEMDQVRRLVLKGDESAADNIRDQCEALRVVIDRIKPTDELMLSYEIQRLFSDQVKGAIILATVHKSKGLEASRVFLLSPEKFIIFRMKSTGEQHQQEKNLDYVARTRAKDDLIYFTNKKFLEYSGGRPAYVQTGFEDLQWTLDEFTKPHVELVPTLLPKTAPALPEPLVMTVASDQGPDLDDDDLLGIFAGAFVSAQAAQDTPEEAPRPTDPELLNQVVDTSYDDPEWDFMDEDDPRDAEKVMVNGAPVLPAEGTTWADVTTLLPAPVEIGAPAEAAVDTPTPTLEQLTLTLETAETPAAPTVKVEPIVVPTPPVPATRDYKADHKREAEAKALTTERQRLVDLVMQMDATQLKTMIGILDAAAAIKGAAAMAMGA